MRKKIDWGMLGLLGVLGIIWATNYAPGTWLAGWDNLMPELNIWMNLKRSIFAVWQEYQGLGLVGGMGHATDLIRQIILLPFILILPNNWIRYLWHFSMMGLGTLGVYWGLDKFNRKERFLGALFYLLNFGTIQYFWAPYEAFSTFWGFFPWLIFSFWRVLQKPNRKNWRLFAFINILVIPSFYVQTLFLVYLSCLVILGIPAVFGVLKRKKEVGKVTKAFGIILLVNSFWLLPFIYFLFTNVHHPRQAIINRLSSEQTFERNQYRGTIKDFLLLRGYYYDFADAGKPLMAVWQKHFSQKWVLVIGYLLGSLVLLGGLNILGKIVKRKATSFEWGVLGIFLLSATALLSVTPPFSYFNHFLRQSPLLDQVFRAPLTKFIVPAAFSFSVLFISGINLLTQKIRKQYFSTAFYVSIFFSILLYSFPAFRGNFIYPKMRVKIPQEYFQLIKFFKTQAKTARIANLPQGSFWGWTFYNWGLRGSGFLWYGIEQPILDRAFDVWNLKNEKYYFHLNYALQNQDLRLLEKIFDHYFVQFVIFDDTVIFPGEKIYAKKALATRELLEKSSRLEKVAQFGRIAVYQFDRLTQPHLTNKKDFFILPDFSQYQIIDPENFNLPYLAQNILDFDWIVPVFKRCHSELEGSKKQVKNKNFIRLISQHDDACLSFWLGQLDLRQPWLVEFEYRHIKGHPPLVSATDGYENYKFFVEKLPKSSNWKKVRLVIPPNPSAKNPFEQGLAISFSSPSYNQFESINDLRAIRVYPIKVEPPHETQIDITTLNNVWSNIWFYRIKTPLSKSSRYLVLPQSFDVGWLAFYFDDWQPKLLKNHVLVNNWANGWEISENLAKNQQEPVTIYLFFWPQILEFIGFGLLAGTFIFIIFFSEQLRLRRRQLSSSNRYQKLEEQKLSPKGKEQKRP